MVACAMANTDTDKIMTSLNLCAEIRFFLYNEYTIKATAQADATARMSVISWSPGLIMEQLKIPVLQYDATKATFHEE